MENGDVTTTKSRVDKNLESQTSPRRVFIELLVSRRFLFPFFFFFSLTDGTVRVCLFILVT